MASRVLSVLKFYFSKNTLFYLKSDRNRFQSSSEFRGYELDP